jgi:hypothetical protein
MEWRIENLREERTESGWRVSADIAGTMFWVESQDIPLATSPEGFVSPFVLAALERGATIHVDDPVSAGWLSRMERLAHHWCRAFGYPFRMPLVCRKTFAQRRSANKRALFFSGGVDSFYSLATYPKPFDGLILVQGFDIPLDDEPLMAGTRKSLIEVSARVGAAPIVLRTNLHGHPCLFGVPPYLGTPTWLVSLAHFAKNVFGEVVLSADVVRSHPAEEWFHIPCFSSDSVRIRLYGDAVSKVGRAATITKAFPWVRQHLRVCWKQRKAATNCSVCEKCVRTMIYLRLCGELDHFASVFDLSVPLCERISALWLKRRFQFEIWSEMMKLDLPADIKWPARRLLWRSYVVNGWRFPNGLAGHV